jgi:magnesium-transporting ATPase (P-type)
MPGNSSMNQKSPIYKKLWKWIVAGFSFILIYSLFTRLTKYYKKKRLDKSKKLSEFSDNLLPLFNGLSEKEAKLRLPQVNFDEINQRQKRVFIFHAIRLNLLTIFNLDLFTIAVVMLLLGNPLGSLSSIGILLLNLVLNVAQEVITKNKLEPLLEKVESKATIIRDGKIKSVDSSQVVIGDLMIIAPGDEILVEGEIVSNTTLAIDETTFGNGENLIVKQQGDKLIAGSFCIEGRAIFQANKPGFDNNQKSLKKNFQLLTDEKTPLKILIEKVLFFMFFMVIFFSFLMVIAQFTYGNRFSATEYQEIFYIIIGIAPTSLFFILVLQYVVGLLRIMQTGALAYRPNTIETIANIDTVCFSLDSLRSGMQFSLELNPELDEEDAYSESLIRHILGDIFHSAVIDDPRRLMLLESVAGEPRQPLETAPFLRLLGWAAISFELPDLRGTFVIAEPDILQPHLIHRKHSILRQAQQSLKKSPRRFSHWMDRLRKKNGDFKTTAEVTIAADPGETSNDSDQKQSDQDSKSSKRSIKERITTSIRKIMTPIDDDDNEGKDKHSKPTNHETVLLFAVLSEPVHLYDSQGLPNLPSGLILQATLHITDVIREEAIDVFQELSKIKIRSKIISDSSIEEVVGTAIALGITHSDPSYMTGEDFSKFNEEELGQKIRNTNFFGNITSSQKAEVIKALRSNGDCVAMVGQSTNDLPAMREANLRCAARTGVQAVLEASDVIFMENSLKALPSVLRVGQRLVNSVLDTFKLYLSFVISQFILIITALLLRTTAFPYDSTEAGIISAFTIALPNVLISVWAVARKIKPSEIYRQLFLFILPASITHSLLAFFIFLLFIHNTGDISYSQIGVTFTLLLAGWLLVLFVQPPSKLFVGGAPLRGDKRIWWLVGGSALLAIISLLIPQIQEWFHLSWLNNPTEYAIVAISVIVWGFVLRSAWEILNHRFNFVPDERN